MSKPTVLIILDGFGWRTEQSHNAIKAAHTPHLDYYFSQYPHTLLEASGSAVGLPDGYIGNSEVGHQTIGSGRITPESLLQINTAITSHSLEHSAVLTQLFTELAHSGKALHLIGLISDAGVHSHIDHLCALIKIAHTYSIKHIYIHAFLDGRDVAPASAALYLKKIDTCIADAPNVSIASLVGRFYAMDRSSNWDRTQQTYELLTHAQETPFHSWHEALDAYYAQHITDEFIPPTQLDASGIVKDGDGILFFNFRPDRARQLAQCFIDPTLTEFARKKIDLAWCITMTAYFHTTGSEFVLFPSAHLTHTLKHVLQENGKTMYSIAETEKYAHITYFFSGGSEKQFPLETRVLIPSLKVARYDEHPCMSAPDITDAVITSLTHDPQDFYLINYANADMVGHSGNFEATVAAIECLDRELGKIYTQVVTQMNGTLYITADHGKAEDMYDQKAQASRTAHTTNLVPFIMIEHMLKGQTHELSLKGLKDIAPFVLTHMGLPVPEQMK